MNTIAMARRWAASGAVIAAVAVSGACSSGHSGAQHQTGATGAPATSRPAGPATTSSSSGSSAPSGLQATVESWRLPAAVSRPVVLPDGNGFVVLGGLATGDVSTSRVVRVDPATGQGVLAGRLLTAVHDSAGAFLGGRWLVFGGGSYSTVGAIQVWSGSGTAVDSGRLPVARSDLSATTVGGTTYIVGGFDGTSMAPAVLATSDGLSFQTVSQLVVPVRYAAVAAAGGALWVMGGVTVTTEGGTAETDAIQKVDLASGRTTLAGHLPRAMGHAMALNLGGTIFLLGGRSGSEPSAEIWRLDAATGGVVPAGQLPQAMSDAGAVATGGVGYLVGGEITGPAAPLDTVVALTPQQGG